MGMPDWEEDIKDTGEALELDRTLSQGRKKFLKNFVQAQMVRHCNLFFKQQHVLAGQY